MDDREKELDGLPLDLRVCNCASCGQLLIAAGQMWHPGFPPKVRGKILGRPYCSDCLDTQGHGSGGTRLGRGEVDASPSFENVVRALEDDR